MTRIPLAKAQPDTAGRVRKRSALTLWILAVLALAWIAGFAALGKWQLERRVWKLDLIQRASQRIHAPAQTAPGPDEWAGISRSNAEYRHVRLAGRFLNDHETAVFAASSLGSGYWILTPFLTHEGFTVLVNRGFVPPEKRQPETRAAGQIQGDTALTGLLRMTEPKGDLLRSNDPASQRWYSRDVGAIATAQGLSAPVAPYFVDLDALPVPGGLPIGGLTVTSFPNNHLQYALTWFALALMLAGGATYVARELWRHRHHR